MKKIILIIFILIIGLYLSRNIIAKKILTKGIRDISGLDLQIASLKAGVFKPVIEIKELKLFNPAAFRRQLTTAAEPEFYLDNRLIGSPEQLMFWVPEFYLDYDLPAFFKGQVHLKVLKLNLREFVVIKSPSGALNLEALKALQPKGGGKQLEFLIDVLELKIGKVIYKDYSKGPPARSSEFNVNVNERYENITNPGSLAGLVIFKALMHTTISKLANFDTFGDPARSGVALSVNTEYTPEYAKYKKQAPMLANRGIRTC